MQFLLYIDHNYLADHNRVDSIAEQRFTSKEDALLLELVCKSSSSGRISWKLGILPQWEVAVQTGDGADGGVFMRSPKQLRNRYDYLLRKRKIARQKRFQPPAEAASHCRGSSQVE